MFLRASHSAFAAILSLSLVLLAEVAVAQPAIMPAELEAVDVNEQLDKKLPLDARFRDHTGKEVRLGDFFDGKRPVVLTLAYNSCKVVCSMVLTATANALKEQPWTLGNEYRAVTISIDHRDTPALAARKRKQMLELYGKSKDGWDFLVGDEATIKQVADAAGFQFRYDERDDQYGHPAVLMLTKPNGEMARYLYGLEFPFQDVRMGLLEASQGRSISTIEKAILYCYVYDPIGAKYVLVAKNVMKLGGALTIFVLGLFLLVMWRREVRSQRPVLSADTHAVVNDDSRGTSRARETRAREV